MEKRNTQILRILLTIFLLLSGWAFAGCSRLAYNPGGLAMVQNVGTNYFISELSPGVIEEPERDGRTVNAPEDPDLVIVSITPSTEQPSKDELVTFTVSFTNQGGSKAHTSFIGYYVDGQSVLSRDIGVVDPGQTKTEEFDWVAEYGTHTFRFVVDVNNQVPESDETNNYSDTSLTTLIPDLELGDLTLTPEQPYENNPVTFTVMVVNNGTGDSVASLIRPSVNNQQLADFFVPAIPSGANTTVSFSYTAKSGPLSISLTIDPENTVEESDETNNSRTYEQTAIVPDLTITDLTWTPLTPEVGEDVQFTATIKNQGYATSSQTRLSFYGGSTSGFQTIPAISANTTYSIDFVWTAESNVDEIRTVIDPGSDVQESDEDNNELKKAITINSPDLVVQDIVWTPLDPSPGDFVTITATILNQGTGDAQASLASFYIDDELTASNKVNAIKAMSVNNTENVSFTWIALEGSHIFRVRADAESVITESDESNNEKSASYPVPPDLIVDALEWEPKYATEGETVVFTFKVTNQGQTRADSSFAGINIDNNYLGFFPIDALDPGQSENGTYKWTAVAGTHSFTVTADNSDKIVELDESNNAHANSFTVTSKTVEDNSASENTTEGSQGTTAEKKTPNIPIPKTPIPEDNTGQLLFLALGGAGVLIVTFIVYDMFRRMRKG